MGGRYSRSKGRTSEYKVRDALRALGYKCERVERSGAGLEKGDLRVEIPDSRFGEHPFAAKFLYGEVKCRHNEFAPVYAWLDDKKPPENSAIIYRLDATAFVGVSYAFDSLGLIETDCSKWITAPTQDAKLTKTFLRLEKFVKGCDFLAIRIDRKQPIYLRYL